MPNPGKPPLGEMSVDTFLADYWQQKPLFIPQALPNWEAPLDVNDLAGLAMEETVESRLIIEKPGTGAFNGRWSVEQGPFSEKRLERLPSSHFTILVQALDQICPDIQALLHRFRFLPNWRLDDIMASLAPTGGGVGPHFDYYDVFLIQATGSRHWRLGQWCDESTPLAENCPLKLLTDFNTTAEYLAKPGDILYVPARLAHWGISQSEDCSTYSVGFRAPAYGDMLLELSQHLAAQVPAHWRYKDQDWTPAQSLGHPGELTQEVIAEVRETLLALITPEQVGSWLGAHLTEAKRQVPDITTDDFAPAYALAPHVRATYVAEGPDQALTFIDGHRFLTSLALAQALTGYTPVTPDHYSATDQVVIADWIANDYLNPP
jgi:50S ribosomal protein L16 3-hydroxylase